MGCMKMISYYDITVYNGTFVQDAMIANTSISTGGMILKPNCNIGVYKCPWSYSGILKLACI